MKKILYLSVVSLVLIFSLQVSAQQMAGAPAGEKTMEAERKEGITKVSMPVQTAADSFATTVYTFTNITVFSYFNDSHIKIFDQGGNLVDSTTLSADTYFNLSGTSGIYRIVGNKTFTVLVGDAITNYVNGYYAVDEGGRGVSTKLNTYMMSSFDGSDEFALFAYEDNTNFTVKDLNTNNIIRAGVLNRGEYYSFRDNGPIPYTTPLQVNANKGVSAISYTDQDYYVPSSNGTFTGNLFYGYSGYAGNWQNSVTVTSYSDSNHVVITKMNDTTVIAEWTLQRGQVATLGITSPTYWKLSSEGPVTAANIPYAGWSGNYAYMTRAIDETGVGAGRLFYVPTVASRIDVFSYENGNDITITQLGLMTEYPYANPVVVWQGTLNGGENYNFYSQFGNYVYKIEGSKNTSVLQSNSGFGADFMPLSYALNLPDLSVSASDIHFSVADSLYVPGDQIEVTVMLHNTGTLAANDITMYAYDGDPDLGGTAPPAANGTIGYINPGDSAAWTFTYTIPNNPQFRQLVIKADPFSNIVEANKSNNKASRFLRPNSDLLPPLSITVTAPSNLSFVNNVPSPNPFEVKYDIFNTGTVSATNVQFELQLHNGLKLLSGASDSTVSLGNIAKNNSASVIVMISADADSSGFNLFSAVVTADNAETKIINRAVNIPDGTAPAAPSNFSGASNDFTCVSLTWNRNSENDIAGYLLYYSTELTAVDNVTPVVIYGMNSYQICGLPAAQEGTNYYFKLKAFDTSNNLSGFTDQVVLLVKDTPVPVELSSFTAAAADKKVVLNWRTETETNNLRFEIERIIIQNGDSKTDKWSTIGAIKGNGTTTKSTDYKFTDDFSKNAVKGEVKYRLKQIDLDNSYRYISEISTEVDFLPKEYVLEQNYPNPFNPYTVIKYSLPYSSSVRINIYNSIGETIKEINYAVKEAGSYEEVFNAASLASGIYYYRMEAVSADGNTGYSKVQKMMLLK